MRVSVKKWGNSAAVRIPRAVMEAARIEVDQAVDVREEAGRIVIEPVVSPAYDLTELVSGITPENLHEAIDYGRPTGRESW